MRKTFARLSFAGLAAFAAVLSIGVAAAAAHGGPGRGGDRGIGGGGSVSSLITQAAKELGVTRAKLVTAIRDAAAARIDSAVADGDVTSDEADDLMAEAEDNLSAAYSLSATANVASRLGVTTTALNNGFKAARKALAVARVDKAFAAGSITSDEAADLKSRISTSTFAGYKAGGLGGGPGSRH